MTTKYAVPDNPYVTLQNRVINICCDRKNFRIPVEDVSKMFLRKRKSKFFSFPVLNFFSEENSYDLHIKTRDNNEVRIKLKAYERQYFLALISYIRNLSKNPTRPLRSIPNLSTTVAA